MTGLSGICPSQIEHSKKKIITSLENEVRPGMLQSGVQQTYNLQIIHKTRAFWITTVLSHKSVKSVQSVLTHHTSDRNDKISGTWFLLLVFQQHSCLSDAGLEHSRSDLVFIQPRFLDNFIFGMLLTN